MIIEGIRKVSRLFFIISPFLLYKIDLSARSDYLMAMGDSSILVNVPETTSAAFRKELSGTFQMTKSPLIAMGLSAVFPCMGQVYNETYWKVPVILGIGGYWVYEWINLNRKYRDFRQLYNTDYDERNLRLRDFYRDERDKFAWFLGALYVLNIVDAYTGAHLYDFDVGPDLTLRGENGLKLSANVRIYF